MINLFLITIAIVLAYIAWQLERINTALRVPNQKLKETPVAVTRGSYAPVATSSNLDSPVGISEAKTPQLIEFESEQELLKANQSLGR